MQYEIVNNQVDGPDNNGLYEKSNGGTEMMYRGLISRLKPELADKFQIICSRVRELDATKKKILWLHDRWDDPENDHFRDPNDLQRFDKLVFVSNYQYETYRQAFKIPYRNSVVLKNAIERFPVQAKPDPSERLNIIYHTTPHRGLEILVPVFKYLVNSFPNIHLDVYSSFEIYGWKERDEHYKNVFDECQNHPNITYHGFKPNSEVREALQNAHIFAYPSIWPETSCISGIEAAAAGCAIVAPDLAALPETFLNFAFMYRYNEDMNEHANMFASVLTSVIKKYSEPHVQSHLEKQKVLFNNVYGWDNRIAQWNEFLESLAK